MRFTKEEVIKFINDQKKVFDIVRLVDVSLTKEYEVTESGEFVPGEYHCYAVWNKNRRCDNCISAKAFALKSQLTKFEFVNDDVYFVMSSYTEVDGTPYMLEMVSKLNDETLFGTFGKNKFVAAIESHNRKLYVDPLTEVYNRRYFDEQLRPLSDINAVVMLDVDSFKSINDTYGHAVGDFVLSQVAKCIQACVRAADAVVRYGGDEFLIVFQNIPFDVLSVRLKSICTSVKGIRRVQDPELRVSVSIGAIWTEKDAAKLVEEADKNLYEAKKQKDTIVLSKHKESANHAQAK
jgi:diguanylate cyclase (GGDEF)-like protein